MFPGLRQASWEDHKRRWENELAARSEQLHREAADHGQSDESADATSDTDVEWAQLDVDSLPGAGTQHLAPRRPENGADDDQPKIAQRLAMLARRKKR